MTQVYTPNEVLKLRQKGESYGRLTGVLRSVNRGFIVIPKGDFNELIGITVVRTGNCSQVFVESKILLSSELCSLTNESIMGITR